MRPVEFQNSWPESWKVSWAYDQQEVFGPVSWRGYANAYRMRHRETLRLIEEAVPAGGRILDVAAAQGNFTLHLAERGYRLVWNDLRADLQGYVQLKHENGDVEYRPGNVFDLGFDQEFDAILITEIIEHVAHPDEFLVKIGKMVRPGGHIVMTTPNGAHMMNRHPKFSECKDPALFEKAQFQPNGDGHIFLLWPDEAADLGRRAGLEVESQTVFTTPWANGRHKTEWLLGLLPEAWLMAVEQLAGRLPMQLKVRLMIHSATRFLRPEQS